MDPLLEALLLRRKSHGPAVGGLQLASDWMSSVIPCLEDAACDLKLHQEASAEQWMVAVKAAQQKTTHTSPDCLVLGSKSLNSSLGVRQVPAVSPGACMDYYTIMTSVNEDRDEDVMHPKGAQIDQAMPVLMYHNPIWPVGKLEKVLDQNDKFIEIHNSLIDNVMGNDAAKMVEYGCLRTSHGFKATKFRERKGSGGYEILEYKVYESSLVPIPANADAVITLHSRQKLHHPANKAWAEHLKAAQPKQVVGGFDGTKGATTVVSCDCKKKEESKTTLGKKAPSAPARVGYDGTLWVGACLSDSWEWVADALEDQAKAFLKGANVQVGDYAQCCVAGTYDDYCVICVLGDSAKASFYKAAWEMKAGEPTLTGAPEETRVTVEVDKPEEDKAAAVQAAALESSGVKLLKMQIAKLKEARDHMAMVKASPELKTTTKAFADTAHGLIHSVINSGKQKAARMTVAKLTRAKELTHAVRTSDELKTPTKTAADAAHKLLGEVIGLMKGGEPDAVAVAAELCAKLQSGEPLDAGAISALREEVSLAEERNLEAELAALTN
jgi:hypothetical protein